MNPAATAEPDALFGSNLGPSWSMKARAVAMLLAVGTNVTRAAQQAGAGRRTVTKWLTDVVFVAEMRRLRSAIFEQAAGKLAGMMTAAADRLGQLAQSRDERIALAAATAILANAPKLREAAELSARLEALEARFIEPPRLKGSA